MKQQKSRGQFCDAPIRLTALCSIGFHCGFANNAVKVIGTYVNMNTGKTMKFAIFSNAVAGILFQSLTRVKNPIM